MPALQDWKTYFNSLGLTTQAVSSNKSALQLTNVAGCPIFRAVDSTAELNDLHTKARQKSSEMERLLVLGLPFDHPQSNASLPGNVTLPKLRVYGGNVADIFSLSGHSIESTFIKNIKQEVLGVIKNGHDVKTPLCDWVLGFIKSSWPYGIPSSLAQLDGMLGLLVSDPSIIGHVRTRQLSFGRGCGDALLLPNTSVVLKNNSLEQPVEPADFRFVSLENEIQNYNASRARIHPVYSDRFLKQLAVSYPEAAEDFGCGAFVGASVLGQVETKKIAAVVSASQVNITMASI